MYIAPSSGEPLPNLNLPFKWILRRFGLFSHVWSENALKNGWKFIQIHQYYMALSRVHSTAWTYLIHFSAKTERSKVNCFGEKTGGAYWGISFFTALWIAVAAFVQWLICNNISIQVNYAPNLITKFSELHMIKYWIHLHVYISVCLHRQALFTEPFVNNGPTVHEIWKQKLQTSCKAYCLHSGGVGGVSNFHFEGSFFFNPISTK